MANDVFNFSSLPIMDGFWFSNRNCWQLEARLQIQNRSFVYPASHPKYLTQTFELVA